MERGEITAELAARLVAGQFPRWANLPVRAVGLNGWDNTTFRLGDELTIRLPNADSYVAQIDKEHRWLPVLAADLAAFLTALHSIDARGGPAPGPHSGFRGGPLVTWDEQTRKAIRFLPAHLAEPATSVWDTAMASAWGEPPRWVHGDVSASNVLAAGGVLHAVIDFGCAAVGDPACDLVMAWTFFTGHSTVAFRDGLPFDAEAAARRLGWRYSPRHIIDVVIADHARSASR